MVWPRSCRKAPTTRTGDSAAILHFGARRAALIAQIIANATFAPLMASFTDIVPPSGRGRASSVLWLSDNVSVLAGTYLWVYLVANLPVLFVAPGLLGLALMIVYVSLGTRCRRSRCPGSGSSTSS